MTFWTVIISQAKTHHTADRLILIGRQSSIRRFAPVRFKKH